MSECQNIVILGGRGDGVVAAQVIKDLNRSGVNVKLLGFLNDHASIGEDIAGYPVLGKTTDWVKLSVDIKFHFCLLTVGKTRSRVELISSFGIPDERLISIIHPTAFIADDVKIGVGVFIAAYVICQPGVIIGDFCSIRSSANIGHDVLLSDYVYVGPNATICGYAKVAKGGYCAPNVVLRDSIDMGAYSVLAAGSVAFKSLPDNSTWIGNPARRAK